jgi:hypothetical protein
VETSCWFESGQGHHSFVERGLPADCRRHCSE